MSSRCVVNIVSHLLLVYNIAVCANVISFCMTYGLCVMYLSCSTAMKVFNHSDTVINYAVCVREEYEAE